MKAKHYIPFLLVLSLCLNNGIAQEIPAIGSIDPSGVWLLWGKGKMNSIQKYSWGENPTYNQATVIDLGDDPPYIFNNGAWVPINKVCYKGNQFYFEGIWNEQKIIIEIHFKDRDTMWFVKFVPGNDLLGEKYFYKRIPANAPVFPIDPEKGP